MKATSRRGDSWPKHLRQILKHWLRVECDSLSVPSDLKKLLSCFCTAMYKLVLLGDTGVGKSALSTRFISGGLQVTNPTINCFYSRFHRRDCFVDGEQCVVDVLDTDNTDGEWFIELRDQWIHESNWFILVYSSLKRDTFRGVAKVFSAIQRIKDDQLSEIGVVLAANKCLEDFREVSMAEGRSLAYEWTAKGLRTSFFETSAKTGILVLNCEEIFYEAIRLAKGNGSPVTDQPVIYRPVAHRPVTDRPVIDRSSIDWLSVENTPVYKLLVLGNPWVGKSAFIFRLLTARFDECYDPDILDSYYKRCIIDGEQCTLDVLETGDCEFSAFVDAWIRDSTGFVLMYSLASRYTFEGLNEYLARIDHIKEGELSQIGVVLAANKCDLEHRRQVSTAEGRSLADEWCAKGVRTSFFETSAKTGINCEEIFYEAIRLSKGNGSAVTDQPIASDIPVDSGSQSQCVIV